MSSANRDAKAIFFEALEQASSEKLATYLDHACGDDAALRARVKGLLQAHRKAGNFLGGESSAGKTVDSPAISEKPGTTIGPYKLLQELGEGGMGVVYMAEQKQPVERLVALKIIKPGMDTRQVIARFEAERHALAMMDHPNIATVLDAGTTESGRPYFVMELVKGIAITRYCDEHHLPTRERLRLFATVCKAIQHAHQKGIIHRDIKPTNVLVAEYDDVPVPKIIDFGVAKAVGQRLTEKTLFTEVGQLVGTVDYMSPEQAKLNQLDVDTRSDVYSLGVLLYELLTGDTPFDRTRLRSVAYDELLRIIREEDPPRPSIRLTSCRALPKVAANRHTEPKRLSTLIRGELDWIVMRSLEKERSRRYDSPSDLADDVDRYLSDQAVEAHPPSMMYRARKFVRRYRAPVAALSTIATILLLAAIGTATGWRQAWIDRAALQRAFDEKKIAYRKLEISEKTTQDALHRTTQLSERQRWHLYIADMRAAYQTWRSGSVREIETMLRRYVPCGNEPDLRGLEWRYLWRLWKRSASEQIFPPNRSNSWTWLAASSDGSRFVVGHPYGPSAFALVDIAHRKELSSFGKGPNRWGGGALAMSADGNTVAYRSPPREHQGSTDAKDDGGVVVRDLLRGTERYIPTGSDFSSVALSPDGGTLAIGHKNSEIWLWDVDAWKKMAALMGHAGQVFSLAFSPDGNRLASVSEDRTVRVWNVATRERLWRGTGNGGPVLCAAYSPSGKFIATGGADKLVTIWDAATGDRLYTLGGPRDEVRALAFSHDETLLAAGCREGIIRLWSVPDFTERGIIAGYSGLYSLAFLQNGNLLYSSQGGHVVTRMVTSATCEVLTTLVQRGRVGQIAFSADSRIVCAINARSPRTIYMWKLAQDGVEQLKPMLLDHDATSLAISRQNTLAVGDWDSGSVQLFDLHTRLPVKELSVADHAGISCAAFSPSGQRLAVGCDDGKVIVWEVEDGRIMMDHAAHKNTVRDLRFCDDEATLLTGSSDRTAKIWDVEEVSLIQQFEGHPQSVLTVDCSGNGDKFLTGTFAGDSMIRLFDRKSNRPVAVLSGHSAAVRDARFLRDGLTVVSVGGDRTVRVWDLATGEQRFMVDADTSIFECLAVSPDELTLAAGGRDGTVRLYRAASIEEVNAEPEWWRNSESEGGRTQTP